MDRQTLEDATQAFYASELSDSGEAVALLFFVSGPLGGSSFALSSLLVKIGRSSQNDLTLSSSAVSGFHCSIERDEHGVFWIVDQGAKNGTMVNGRRMESGQRLRLNHGDSLTICDSVCMFLSPRKTMESDHDLEIKVNRDSAEQAADKLISGFPQLRELGKRPGRGSE